MVEAWFGLFGEIESSKVGYFKLKLKFRNSVEFRPFGNLLLFLDSNLKAKQSAKKCVLVCMLVALILMKLTCKHVMSNK